MKLVLRIRRGDGCSCAFSCMDTIPFEYKSKEKFLFDLELKLEELLKNNSYEAYTVGGVRFTYEDGMIDIEDRKIYVDNVEVFELDEWWEKYRTVTKQTIPLKFKHLLPNGSIK